MNYSDGGDRNAQTHRSDYLVSNLKTQSGKGLAVEGEDLPSAPNSGSWYCGSRADTALKQPLHTEHPTAQSLGAQCGALFTAVADGFSHLSF